MNGGWTGKYGSQHRNRKMLGGATTSVVVVVHFFSVAAAFYSIAENKRVFSTLEHFWDWECNAAVTWPLLQMWLSALLQKSKNTAQEEANFSVIFQKCRISETYYCVKNCYTLKERIYYEFHCIQFQTWTYFPRSEKTVLFVSIIRWPNIWEL